MSNNKKVYMFEESGEAYKIISERLKQLNSAKNDDLRTSIARDAYSAINYLIMYDLDDNMKRAIVSITEYIKYLEELIRKRE